MADITEARLRITAQDDTAGAFAAMKDRVSGLMGQFNALNGVLGSFGAALSVGAFAAFVKNTLDAAARLDDMAEATGASVEELSRLSQIAKIGGHDLGTVETAMLRLTKAVSDGSKTQAAAFEAVGLSMKQLQALNADEQIETLARTLASFEDGAGKAAVGVALFGKAWKDVAPLLKDIAERGAIVASVTADQAAAAEKAQKTINELALAFERLGQSITLNFIGPALRGFETLNAMIEKHGLTGALSPGGLLEFSLRVQQQSKALALGAGIDDTRELKRGQRSIAFVAPDPEAEAAKKAELRRLATFAAGLEEDAVDRMRANMREEDRLIKEQLKVQEDAQKQIAKGWVEVIEQQIEGERMLAEVQERERDKRIAEEKRAADELARAQERAAEESRRAWERQFDIVSESLTDALMRGFEGGEDFAKNFANTLKNMFQSLVLRPVIQAIVSPVAGAITAALGSLFPGVAQAGTGLLGGGGGLNILSNVGSLFSGGLFAGGFTGLYGTGLGSVMESLGLATLTEFSTGTMALTGLGSALSMALPVLGVAAGLAGLLGGKKKSPAVGIGVQGTGTVGMGGLDLSWLGRSKNATQEFSWQTFNHFQALGVQAEAEQMVKDLFTQWSDALTKAGLDASRLQSFRAPIDFLIPAASPQELSGSKALAAFEQGLQSVTQALTEEFGPALQAVAQRTQLEAALAQGVRGLPGALGIPGLEAFQGSLAVAEFQAPLDRVAAARRLLGENFAAAMGGDLGAVGTFPQFAQQVLAIGREVFASGPQFAEMFVEVNRMLQDVLGRQRDIQADILKDIDVSILEASRDQIAELRKGFKDMVDALAEVKTEIRRMAEAA